MMKNNTIVLLFYGVLGIVFLFAAFSLYFWLFSFDERQELFRIQASLDPSLIPFSYDFSLNLSEGLLEYDMGLASPHNSPLIASSLLIAQAYTLFSGQNNTALALDLLKEADYILARELSTPHNSHTKQLLLQQQGSVDMLKTLLVINECVVQTLTGQQSLQFLLDQLPLVQDILQKKERMLGELLLTVDVRQDRACLLGKLSETRQLLTTLSSTLNDLLSLGDSYKSLTAGIQEITQFCSDNNQDRDSQNFTASINDDIYQLNRYVLSLEQLLYQELQYSGSGYITHYCEGSDNTNTLAGSDMDTMQEKLQQISDDLQAGHSEITNNGQEQDTENENASSNESIGGPNHTNDDINDDTQSPDTTDAAYTVTDRFDNALPKNLSTYIQQLESGGIQWQENMNELLKYQLITPEKILRDQYSDFYGDDSDFVSSGSTSGAMKQGDW